MAYPIAGHLQRVDRKHDITGGQQRLHPRPAFGLDPDHHLIGLTGRVEMLSDQLVQHRDTGQALRHPFPDQQPAGVVFDLDIMVGLGPIVSDEQHPRLLDDQRQTSPEKTCYDLMDQCSIGTTSH